MKPEIKKQKLDAFALKMGGVVKKYECYGIYASVKVCEKCTVKRQCKEASR